jgi:pimeloyl-ACP methyl ester carboxylesterase
MVLHVRSGAPARSESAEAAEDVFLASGLRCHLRRAPVPALGTVVFIHGGLDGGASFTRAARRLAEFDVITYDRRGYRGSRGVPVEPGLAIQIQDLATVLEAARLQGVTGPQVAVGHSHGGLIALGAAATGVAFDAAAAWEPPFPWLRVDPFSHHREMSLDPATEAESFFRRMVGDTAWERLGAEQRNERLADGEALLADLQVLRGEQPFDPSDISMPVVLGLGSRTEARHAESVLALHATIPGSHVVEFDDVGHGAHLSSPDRFAELARRSIGGI